MLDVQFMIFYKEEEVVPGRKRHSPIWEYFDCDPVVDKSVVMKSDENICPPSKLSQRRRRQLTYSELTVRQLHPEQQTLSQCQPLFCPFQHGHANFQ